MCFFGIHGNELFIRNYNEFTEIYSELGGPVEKRTHDSSKEEIWVLLKFLEYKTLNKNLDYPIHIKKSEQPDFLISNSINSVFGLELTESTDPMYRAAWTLAENRGKGESPIDSYFKQGHLLKHKDLEKTLKSPNEPLRGMPWIGNEGLKKTKFDLKQIIAKKLKHYNENTYQDLKYIDLLIYYNGPSGIHTRDEHIKQNYKNIVSECIEENKTNKVFNNIHLLWSRTMLPEDNSYPYLVLTWTRD